MGKERSEACDQGKHTTTLRMGVTADEHRALYEYARKKLNLTVEAFLRQAVEEYLDRWEHKCIAEMAEAARNRGKIVQEELF